MVMARQGLLAHNPPVRCVRHSLPCGPDGQCIVCLREPKVRRASRAALLALAATALLTVGGAVGYRVAATSFGATETVARNLRPASSPLQASLLAQTVHPTQRAPSTAPDLAPEQGLREFQSAIANAWRLNWFVRWRNNRAAWMPATTRPVAA